MKNLNPLAGLRQNYSGYITVSRKLAIDLIKDNVINTKTLGYYLIFVLSADWDSSIYRKGYIRQPLPQLAQVWSIPYSTLFNQYNKLVKAKLISVDQQGAIKITNFDQFTFTTASQLAKQKPTDEMLVTRFDEMLSESQKSQILQSKHKPSFKYSSKKKSIESLQSFGEDDESWIDQHLSKTDGGNAE